MSNEEIQNALNDWMDKIEKQINEVEDTVGSMPDTRTIEVRMKDFQNDIVTHVNSIQQTAVGAEQLANRLTDDALAGQEDLRK